MHDTSYNGISALVNQFMDKTKLYSVLDVGSYDVNGNYKSIFNYPGWSYLGVDIAFGPNVDKCIEPYQWDLQDNSYDVVLSGQCLEHVEMPWLWIKEAERVCKPGGLIILTAPWCFPIHQYPVDCWRLLPDGMSVLLTKVAHTTILHLSTNDNDCFAVARKPYEVNLQ
jgi:SAM-dependent methyltransferase